VTTLTQLYDRRVAEGRIERDPNQVAALASFERVAHDLRGYRLPAKSGALGWMFTKKPGAAPKGLYVHGQVGRGKTMLMDLFFETVAIEKKRRAHFHAFMADVHKRVHAWRQAHKAGHVKGDDPIVPVANALADEATLLCFDEFAVNDIADAMILGRLFEAMFSRGVVVVATSNVAPIDLYKDGLNRALFLPFVKQITERMHVLRLDSRTDFRLEKLGGAQVYLVPPDAAATAALDRIFLTLTGVATAPAQTLEVMGRALVVPQAARGVARFSFAQLCEAALGPNDYLEIALSYHTVICDGVRKMDIAHRNAAKRFITLIDALYDCNARFVCSAEAPAERIYHAEQGREVFEFERTTSRLIEMRSDEYLARPHGRQHGSTPHGIVET
jgi:cell division protein ZapE